LREVGQTAASQGRAAATSPPAASPAATGRRALQLTLGVIWLLDAALQYQPYMFSKAFVSEVIFSTAPGNPGFVSGPVTWAAGVMVRHIAVYNALFATIQLLLGLGLLWRPAVKAALAASAVWAAGVWWLAEGLGGVLTGTANPVTGAPGAAVLYVLLAALAWPARADGAPGASVATSGWLGPVTPRVLWAVLWGSLGYTALQPAGRTPDGLAGAVAGMKEGEPGWVSAIDGALAHALAHHGTQAAAVIAALCALAAVTVGLGRLTRVGLVAAAALGALIWLAEDFGEVFTGQGTDPNSGLMLIVVAAAFWPLPARRPAAAPPRGRTAGSWWLRRTRNEGEGGRDNGENPSSEPRPQGAVTASGPGKPGAWRGGDLHGWGLLTQPGPGRLGGHPAVRPSYQGDPRR
jgi:hypothetical protein